MLSYTGRILVAFLECGGTLEAALSSLDFSPDSAVSFCRASMDRLMTIAHFVFYFMTASNISKSRGSGELILTPVLGQWSVWLQLVHMSSPRGCSSELYPATRRELESIRWTSGVLLELLMKTVLQEGSIEFTGALGSMLIPPWWRGRNKDGGGEGTNIIIRFQILSEWMGDVSLNHKFILSHESFWN